jgi:hypothetical protein
MAKQTPSSLKKSRARQLITGLLLALGSSCIALFVLEGTARLLPPPYQADTGEIYACHPTLGWTGRPNYHGIIDDPNFRQELNFNSLGMHDTDHPLQKPADTYRIMLLGDSFVHAIQVAETETAHQVLEDRLNEQARPGDPHYEVISSGVVNWGTNQELIYYREQGRRFQPDLVLLMFYLGNDFQDNLPGNVLTIGGINCYAPYLAVCAGELQPQPLYYAPGLTRLENRCLPIQRPLISNLGKLYRFSRLYQRIEPLLVANRPRQEFGRAFPRSLAALYLPEEEPELSQAWQITLATLAQLQQEVEADGTQFAVGLISPEIIIQLGVLSTAEQEVFLRDNPLFANAQIDQPNRRLAEFMTRQHIPFIDLTGPMTEHLAANKTPLYLLGEGHWTVEGNRVAAETIEQWLTKNQQFQLRR